MDKVVKPKMHFVMYNFKALSPLTFRFYGYLSFSITFCSIKVAKGNLLHNIKKCQCYSIDGC